MIGVLRSSREEQPESAPPSCGLFAGEGARVAFCSRSEQPGRDLEQELKSEGCDVVFSRCDAAIETEAKALVKLTLDRYGGIDILVNNAAVSKLAPVEEMSLNDWELILSKNLTSMFLMSRESIPILRRSPIRASSIWGPPMPWSALRDPRLTR